MDIQVNHLLDVIQILVSHPQKSNEKPIFEENLYFLLAPIQHDIVDPCHPSPCGPYSECRNSNGAPSCSCLPSYTGVPPNCRPECTINPECTTNRACIREKCIDPCPGSCGLNAQCHVINHTPICTCFEKYIGDPFTSCHPAPTISKMCTCTQNYLYITLNINFS